MNIREEILREHSKAQCLRIAQYIGDDKQRFEELMYLFLNDEYLVYQRAAWVVSTVANKYPDHIQPHILPMLENLKNNHHPSVTRNTVRVLRYLDKIPESSIGLAASICFKYLTTPSVPIAIRVFSMHILYKICLVEPDLKEELKMSIEDGIWHGSAGYKSVGRTILQKLLRLKQ